MARNILKIPEKRIADMTERQFVLRHDNDDCPREPHGRYHRDDYFMIGVVTSGQYLLSIDFENHYMTEGCAVIISPGQVHAPLDDSNANGFKLALSLELLTGKDLSAIKELQFTNKIIHLPTNDLCDIVGLYEILKRRRHAARETELALVTAIKSIIIANIKAGTPIVPDRYQRITIKLQQLLEQHICKEKSPTKYASLLNVSSVYLNEAIKGATGRNVTTMIGEYVTTLAKRELCHTQLSAQQIAFNLGYDDYGSFARLFKRHAGMSPNAFRNKYLE